MDITSNEDWLRPIFSDDAIDDEKIPDSTEEAEEIQEPEDTLPIISLTDDDGIEHIFEELDILFYNDKEYVALLPVSNEASGMFFNEQIAILVRNYDYDDEIYLETIDDSEEFALIRNIFEERLADFF